MAVVLLGVELLLLAFSIGAALVDQSALAIMAGTVAITLAGEIVRRLLTSPTRADPVARDGEPGGPADGEG